MEIAVGGDHAGFPLKGTVVEALRSRGHSVTDLGTHTPEPVDFPDLTRLVCDAVRGAQAERAIMVCGTGVGA
jgi:ribose 5-phosphate isomerase B